MNQTLSGDGMGHRSPTRAPASRRSLGVKGATLPRKAFVALRVSLVEQTYCK